MALSADESFATVAESVTYATKRAWADWLAATEATQEAKLREATDYIVMTARWPGSLADYEQALPFPRIGAYDREGRYIEGTPDAVKAATIEAARLALGGLLIGGTSDAQVVIRRKVGPIEREFSQPRSAADVRRDRLAYVHLLLRGAGAIIGGANVALLKS